MYSDLIVPSRRAFLKGALCGAGSLLFGHYPVYAQRPASKSLPRATPESVGIDPGGIRKFVDAVDQKVGGLHSFMLMRKGMVAAEGWWAPYAPEYPHSLFSLSKSFTSTAIGIAVAERKLSLDTRVASIFNFDLPNKVSENLAAMKLRHLLTMSTGHDKDATQAMTAASDGNWARAFLSLPVEHAPGSKFVYNSAATYMCAVMLKRLTAHDPMEYLQERLFQPLGIRGQTWDTCPRGIAVGGWGLSIKTEDIAKFGQLYLQKGKWEGQQLLPESWVEEATGKQVSNGDPATGGDWNQGYGYQFWRCRHGHYRGDGAFGQFCIVMPQHEAVLAITSGVADMAAVMNLAWENLLPAMRAESAPTPGQALPLRFEKLTVKPVGQSASPDLVKQITGKLFRFDQNDQKVESIRLSFGKKDCRVTLKNASGEQSFRCGVNEWIDGRASLDAQPPAFVRIPENRRIAASGGWTSGDTYTIKVCLVETPFVQTIACKFVGDSVELTRRVNVAFGATEWQPLLGTVQSTA